MSEPTTQQKTQTPDRAAYPATRRRLTRSRNDAWLGGVCGGVAEYAGVDPTVVRLLVVLGTVLGLGSLVLVYLVAWLLVPQD